MPIEARSPYRRRRPSHSGSQRDGCSGLSGQRIKGLRFRRSGAKMVDENDPEGVAPMCEVEEKRSNRCQASRLFVRLQFGRKIYVSPLPHRASSASTLFALVQTILTTLVTFSYWEGSGGGCGLVEEPPSLDESARAAQEGARLPVLNCFVSGVTLRASDTTMIFVSVIVAAAYLAGI
jgi:hypothetical protein